LSGTLRSNTLRGGVRALEAERALSLLQQRVTDDGA
jgi:hypothetical protein